MVLVMHQDQHSLAALVVAQPLLMLIMALATLQVQVHLKEQVVVVAAAAAVEVVAEAALLEQQEVLVLRQQGQWELVATVVMEQPHQLLVLL